MSKVVLIVLAEGFEEIEAVTPMDVLRRAGLDVIIAGVGGKAIKGAHGITVNADVKLEDYKEVPDAVYLPGGLPGAVNLGKSAAVRSLLRKMNEQKKTIAAICAAPAAVLAPAGLVKGKRATCYPGFEKELGAGEATFTADRVVQDGHVFTSRGPGTAMEFSIELARQLAGESKAAELKQGMLAV